MAKFKKKKQLNNKPQKPQEKPRKLIRKEKRIEKKNRRVAYFAKKAEYGKSKDNPSNTLKQKAAIVKQKGAIVKEAVPKEDKIDKLASKSSQSEEALQNIQKEHAEKEKLEKEMAKQRRIQLLEANKEEDREIRRMEKLLKLNKRKKKAIPKSFYKDNLGSLLEVCDRDYLQKLAETEKTIQDSGSEFEEDFAAVTGKKLNKKKTKNTAAKSELTATYADGSDLSDTDISELHSDSDDSPDEVHKTLNKNKKVLNKPKEKKTGDTQKPQKEWVSDSVSSENSASEDDEVSISDHDESDENSDFGLGVDDGSETESEEDSDEYQELKNKRSGVTVTDELHKANSKGKNKRVHFSDEVSFEGTKKQKLELTQQYLGKRDKNTEKSDVSKMEQAKRPKDATNLNKKTKAQDEPKYSVSKSDEDNDEDEDCDDDGDDDGDFGNCEDDSSDDSADRDDETKNKPSGAVKRNKDGTWEDIYGRARSSTGEVIQQHKYVPPALRAETSDSKRKELERLRREMKGMMNRLAENNMTSISSKLDEMYMTKSRHDMNDTLTRLTLEALISPVLTPDRLVMEHCLLISLLHANVGSEVGAHFLQAVVQKFDELLPVSTEVEDKRLDNIVHILSHLYNFKIFSSSLVLSILDKVSQVLNEKRVDLLLLILRTVGSTLRKDEPNAMKSLVLQLQTKASATPQLQKNSRVKFMLEVLMAIKNNNMSKIPNYSPEDIDHAKKLLRSLIRRGKYVSELNISLDDLLKADQRGRWWIVGSAWTGHLPGESHPESVPKTKDSASKVNESEYNADLLELARKQRMNTDTRRNIFCILLTAEDYLDAFEKLMHLNLKNQQEQEIIHVLLHCSLQEKNFNPYYAHLAQKFCDFDRKYQMKIQYCVWDKLKDLGSLQGFQISNLARLLAHLFLEKGLPISILKVVSFAEIDKMSVRLIRQILLNVLLVADRNESEAVFLRVAPSPKLRLFREGLRLFIRHFMLRPSSTKFLSEEELALLEERATMAERALSAAESEVQF